MQIWMHKQHANYDFRPKDSCFFVLRTGAAHSLADFSGCGRTRRTRSNDGPVKNENRCNY